MPAECIKLTIAGETSNDGRSGSDCLDGYAGLAGNHAMDWHNGVADADGLVECELYTGTTLALFWGEGASHKYHCSLFYAH